MFKKIFKRFSKDMGIDLGTANTLVYIRDKGIVINEPSVVAVNTKTEQILAIGDEAKKMVGKTPSHITAMKPLVSGVISDFEVTEKMLKYFIEKVHQERFGFLPRPRIVIAIPLGITEVEKKAVEDATLHAGASEVFLIEEPMVAAIGARLPIQDASGNIVVDIGGGTTEIAVISLGGVVASKSLKVAGNEFDRNIIQYTREEFNLLIGEKTAEECKKKIGSAMVEDNENKAMKIRGRDLISGLPKEVTITSSQVKNALNRSLKTIVENIKNTIESTPPELVSDIYTRGIVLTGGGALLNNLSKVINMETKIPVNVTDDPLTCVVRGTGLILEDFENLKEVLITPSEIDM
ncbi:MAG: rod shape-determining protein [Patescibacteria group bacterium]|nr:rod shape-determining protein [Patescibacteria group bacterium]